MQFLRPTYPRLLTAIIVFLLTCVAGSGVSIAEDDNAFTVSAIDFGVPCTDPLEESDVPKVLERSRTPPKSDPSKPLTSPPYPPVARRLGEEGTAVIKLLVSESGEISQARIATSTGSSRLDSAALEHMRTWHLQPGRVDGKPRCMWGRFAVTFVLTDYTEEELLRVDASPDARELAHQLIGIEQLREILSTAGGGLQGEAGRQVLHLTVDAASRRPEWIKAEDKVARILATEFTAPELGELKTFYASAVAKKWTRLYLKMGPSIQAQQQLVAQTLMCSTAGVSGAIKAAAGDAIMTEDSLADKYAAAIPKYVEAALPYCACLVGQAGKQRTAGGNEISRCGLPPRLE